MADQSHSNNNNSSDDSATTTQSLPQIDAPLNEHT
jgi:hypothetical protein